VRLYAQSDRSLIRAGASSTRYARLSFTLPDVRRTGGRLPINVALVLDRSGSMAGEKIALARGAARQALDLLRSDDRFAVVVYDDVVDLVAESAPATADARRRAHEALAATDARGATDLAGGWLRGCEQVGLSLRDGTIGRCLLLTDGLANRGITDPAELFRHAEELRVRGVSTSTFGVGADFDERLLKGIAERSGGRFYFLEQPRQIPDILAGEVGEALEIVARGATLTVELPPDASVEVLGGFILRQAGGAARIDLGDLVSRQELEVLLALRFPPGAEGRRARAGFCFGDLDGAVDATEAVLEWTYASHAANDRQPRERVVDRSVARAYAGQARAAATELNRAHDFAGARRVLHGTAQKIRQYAGSDSELRSLARELERQAEELSGRALNAMELKQRHFAEYALASMREPDGLAKRAPRR
jgi:Ca-activated chloride channel family protein